MADAERMIEPPPLPGATPEPMSGVADAGKGDANASIPPPPAEVVDPLLGKVIDGRFRILSLLARGGMGRVYRAEQVQLGRVCAVKVLHPKYTGDRDPEFARRFFLEAKIASQLTHPNTVTIFDYGQDKDEDVFFMAMELLEGVTLHRAVRTESPFPAERVAYIGRQICRSLREAHRLGVIHRDLKPANVILTPHGDELDFVKVLDFGLVKQIEGAIEELTQTGLFMGSPKYMAPEAIRGDPVDGRADIYSLGVMMYEMACGKVPFEKSNSLGTLMAHVNDAPPSLESMRPGLEVPAELTETIFGCLVKDPDQRFATMDDVLVALKNVSTGPHGHTGEYRTGAPPAVSPSGMHPAHASSRPPPSISGALSARPQPLPVREAPLESIFDELSGLGDRPGQLVEPPFNAHGHHEPSGSSGPMGSAGSGGAGGPSRSGVAPVLFPPRLPLPSVPPDDTEPHASGDLEDASASGVSGSGRTSLSSRPSRLAPAPRERASALWGIAGGAAVVLAVAAVMWVHGDTRDPRFGAGSLQPLGVVTAQGNAAAPGASDPARVRSVADLPLAPSASASATSATSVTFRVTSEPAGAQVRENGVELCTATPCDLLFRGEAAASGREHRLTILRAGFRAETTTVHPEEGSASVHLTRAGGGAIAANPVGAVGAGGASNASASSPRDTPRQAPAPAPASTGFKELPY